MSWRRMRLSGWTVDGGVIVSQPCRIHIHVWFKRPEFAILSPMIYHPNPQSAPLRCSIVSDSYYGKKNQAAPQESVYAKKNLTS